MANYFKYVIKLDDGYTQEFVGNPQSSFSKAEWEIIRLVNEECYDLKHLFIVKCLIRR